MGGAIGTGAGGAGGSACGGTTGSAGSGGDNSELDRCHQPFQPPPVTCPLGCLVQLTKGGAPTILYERPNDEAFDIQAILAVTDDYVIARALWGAPSWSDPEAVWGVVEVPRKGGPPVLVDTFGSGAWWLYARGVMGGDGAFYYIAGVGPAGSDKSGSVLLRRVSTTHFGEPATVVASVPGSYWDMTFTADGDHVYLAAEWGIGRVPKAGGALEVLIAPELPHATSDGALTVSDGFVYYSTFSKACWTSYVERVPAAGGAAQTIATGGPRLLFGGSPATLFAAEDRAVRRFDPGLSQATTILTTDTGGYHALERIGTTLYVVDECPTLIPDGPSEGSFVRTYDLVTGKTGYLEDEPGYPFVPGPTGLAHDAAGETLFYIQ